MTAPTDKLNAILASALALFVERGYHGTSVPTIADRAHVAAGTIYHHFASKEELVNAVFRTWKEQIAREVHAGFPAAASTREQFRAIWTLMARFALAHRDAYSFLEFHYHGSYLDAANRALDAGLKQFAAMVIGGAQASGIIKPIDSTLLMEIAFGAFNGMMRAHYEGRIVLDDAAIAAAESACWDAVAV